MNNTRKKGVVARGMTRPPSVLEHAAGVIRAKTGVAPTFEAADGRHWAMTITAEKDGKNLIVVLSVEKIGRQWILTAFEGSRDGEPLDLSEGMQAVMDLLSGAGEPGISGVSAVTHASGTTRDRGVEVRKGTVIRT